MWKCSDLAPHWEYQVLLQLNYGFTTTKENQKLRWEGKKPNIQTDAAM